MFIGRGKFLIVSLVSLVTLPALAQNAPFLRRNNVEVGVFPGASFGVDKSRFLIGSNAAWAATKYIMPYGEFTYFPELSRPFTTRTPVSVENGTYNFRLYDIHGGVHIRLPIRESRIVPYGAAGVGYLRSLLTAKSTTTVVGNPTPSAETTTKRNANDLSVNFGGGLRFYVSQRWGFRLEGKVYRTTNGDLEGFFGKFVGGVFYQLR